MSTDARRVGRLAPSPTGFLHLGHARTFLLAWWHARGTGSELLLRIEDLDGPRARPEFNAAAQRDLEWLGLDWDGAPLLQSDGLPALDAMVEQLLREGNAYPCVCTRGDLRLAQSAPQLGVNEPRYPGTCRGRYASLAEARDKSGREPGVRLVVAPGSVSVRDEFAGEFSADVAAEVGDFLIARRGGQPAYQLAVVVDDAAQNVTDVVRGEDLLPSTVRQWHVRRALGLASPAHYHVPLVLDEGGRRLAKRADDLSLRELREGGTDPRAVVAWAAESAGLEVPERVTPAQALASFDFAKVPREPVTLSEADVETLKQAR
jgi:glutamyl-tRNA synthetase